MWKITGKRANFINIQMSQFTPTEHSEPSRVRTGFEKVMAHRTQPPFAYPAEQDGKILEVDAEAGLAKIQYSDGGLYVVTYGNEYSRNGGGGFYVEQRVVLNNFKTGDRFKRGDIIAYNRDFFTADVFSKQVIANLGHHINTVVIEGADTMEDSSAISKVGSKGLTSHPVQARILVITPETNIHSIATVGTKVEGKDPLMIFDESPIPSSMADADEDTMNALKKLNRSLPKAKYAGEVVKIESFYKDELTSMTPSLAKVIKTTSKSKKDIAEFAKGTEDTDMYIQPGKTTATKAKGVYMDDDTVVLVFYIRQTLLMEGGDKDVFSSSLKSVASKVLSEDLAVEDGSVVVNAKLSGMTIHNRIVESPAIQGIGNRMMEEAERQLLEMWRK